MYDYKFNSHAIYGKISSEKFLLKNGIHYITLNCTSYINSDFKFAGSLSTIPLISFFNNFSYLL